MHTETPILKLSVQSNAAYSPDQIIEEGRGMRLADLLDAVQYAIDEHGEDAEVVLDNGQRYGAQFGYIATMGWGEVFELVEEEDEEEEEDE